MNIDIRAIMNKANGQITASFPKKKLPKKLIDLMKTDPKAARYLKLKIEGFK